MLTLHSNLSARKCKSSWNGLSVTVVRWVNAVFFFSLFLSVFRFKLIRFFFLLSILWSYCYDSIWFSIYVRSFLSLSVFFFRSSTASSVTNGTIASAEDITVTSNSTQTPCDLSPLPINDDMLPQANHHKNPGHCIASFAAINQMRQNSQVQCILINSQNNSIHFPSSLSLSLSRALDLVMEQGFSISSDENIPSNWMFNSFKLGTA